MNADHARAWIVQSARRLHAARAELDALDAVAGDGVHGTAMVRGFDAAAQEVAAGEVTAADVLERAGTALTSHAGTPAGALLGRAIRAMAEQIDAGVGAALIAAVRSVEHDSGASVGDKTMLDALAPAAACGDDIDSAAVSARRGADLTMTIVGTVERDRFGEAGGFGHADVGATTVAILLETLADVVAGPSVVYDVDEDTNGAVVPPAWNRWAATPRPVIGYLTGQLPTYSTEQFDVIGAAITALGEATEASHCSLVVHRTPVLCADDAGAAAQSLVAAGVDLVVLHHASFTLGDVTTAVAAAGVPIVIWTADEPTTDGPIVLNSLASGLAASSIVRATRRGTVDWWHGLPGDPVFDRQFAVTTGALRARVTLARTKIGFLGGTAPTFENLRVGSQRLRSRIGPVVDKRPLGELFALIKAVPPNEVADELAEMRQAVGRFSVAVEADLVWTAATAIALRREAADKAWTAMAVSDWPQFQDVLGIHPGFAYSWVDHRDGLSVACDGDVMGAVSQVALRSIARAGACLLDVVSIAPDRSALQLWQRGGSPLDLADDSGIGVVDHSTPGRKAARSRQAGAVVDMVLRPGPVTLLRFGNDLERAFVAQAEVVAGPSRGFDGTRGWVTGWSVGSRSMAATDMAELLMTNGVEHHLALVGGHYGAEAVRLLRWLGLETIL